MFKKSMLVALAGVLMLQLTACGTLFYGERKGKPASSQIDPAVLVLDCCGLLFGIIPGVVAIVIDYSNKTIYYTKGFINFDPAKLAEFLQCARERNPRAEYREEV